MRSLERTIGNVSRKVTKDIYQGKKKKVTVTRKAVRDYLGTAPYELEKENLKDEVGIVHGLAWTSVGGVMLNVEVNTMPGKGKFIVTGSLGDVMKESAQAAVSYIRSKSGKYKIKDNFFENHDIHIHIPEGAVPKDGPSAGITMTPCPPLGYHRKKSPGDCGNDRRGDDQGTGIGNRGTERKNAGSKTRGHDKSTRAKGQ